MATLKDTVLDYHKVRAWLRYQRLKETYKTNQKKYYQEHRIELLEKKHNRLEKYKRELFS